IAASSPTIVSTATSPCVDATCASFGARGSPMQSPIAHTPFTLVRMRSSTVIPSRLVAKPAFSTPVRFATRPAPRSTSSPANELGIGVREGLRQHLEHGDLGPELRVERPELQTDRATADHDEPLRWCRERERSDVVERLRFGQTFDRRHPDLRAGRDDDASRVDGLLAARRPDPQLRRRNERALALDQVHLARFEQLLDAGDVLRHDGILSGDGLREIETRPLNDDPVLLAVRRDPVRVTRIQERLRRDTTHGHADPTDTIPLDERDTCPLDTRVERRNVTTRAAAKDGDVI